MVDQSWRAACARAGMGPRAGGRASAEPRRLEFDQWPAAGASEHAPSRRGRPSTNRNTRSREKGRGMHCPFRQRRRHAPARRTCLNQVHGSSAAAYSSSGIRVRRQSWPWYRVGGSLIGRSMATRMLFRVAGPASLPAVLFTATVIGQAVDRSQPPRLEASAGGFTVRRLTAPIEIDGRAWIAVTPIIAAQTVRAPNGQFAIRLAEETAGGDVERFRVSIVEGSGPPVQVVPGTAANVYITPDSRWIVGEILEAVDVRAWRTYSLSKAFGIAPYVIPRAISADGRRLFIVKRACPFDCRDIPDEYYEIRFPEI